jgi:hypothetical protein
MLLGIRDKLYGYKPLAEPDSIRLIELRPCLDKNAQIECSLTYTSLSQIDAEIIDHYTALSYVWGDPKDLASVLVENLYLQVTTNLECALRHLRDGTRLIYVWADAICINQLDVSERNLQVSQMGEIY